MTLTIIIPKQSLFKVRIKHKWDGFGPKLGIVMQQQASGLSDIVISLVFENKRLFSLDNLGIIVIR
jgi:hypothetical protein